MSVSLSILDHRLHTFGRERSYEHDARIVDFHQTLLGLYDKEFDEQYLKQGAQNTFSHMGEVLLSRLQTDNDLQDVDLLVLGHCTPDINIWEAVVNRLIYQFDLKQATGFAISDRGGGTPYTALKVIRQYMHHHGKRKAVLLLLDQFTLPNYEPVIHQTDVQDTGFVMLLDQETDHKPKVIQVDTVSFKEYGGLSLEDWIDAQRKKLHIAKQDLLVINHSSDRLADPQVEQVLLPDQDLVVPPLKAWCDHAHKPYTLLCHYDQKRQFLLGVWIQAEEGEVCG
ncbi:hypothetical protein IC620_10830 [Hazenella sp. IB182357]|uniref:Uncharacterized protein n=1 Tax=Polycladospora coralii TaxID=2771432 RepID=A0A926NBQ7_9BACL|nr:hypothetical protein [Polycladospora coralii]MBD1372850.1 hypothetical protein [Polycladospora coralii]